MAHNPPTYFSHNAPSYCRVCGANLIDIPISKGFDEKTGEEILINAKICSLERDNHGVIEEIVSSEPKKVTFFEFLSGK